MWYLDEKYDALKNVMSNFWFKGYPGFWLFFIQSSHLKRIYSIELRSRVTTSFCIFWEESGAAMEMWGNQSLHNSKEL